MKKVLITGSSGFVGRRLASILSERGIEVVPYDLKEGQDIFNAPLLEESLTGVDTVFHLAAMVSVPESIVHPEEAFRVNAEGTKRVLEAAQVAGVKRFVYSSSAAVFGNPTLMPVDESTPTNPLSPYGASKLKGEEYVRNATGIETVSLRYMNILGKGQDPKSPYAAVLPLFLHKIKNNEPIAIEGDGEQTRDFIYLDDVVAANITAAEVVPLTQNVFCIGTGVETSINRLAETLLKYTSSTVPIIHTNPRVGDIKNSVADISRAKQVLGWEPQMSFDEAIRRILAS